MGKIVASSQFTLFCMKTIIINLILIYCLSHYSIGLWFGGTPIRTFSSIATKILLIQMILQMIQIVTGL